MFILLFLLSLPVLADSESKFAFEKSFPRDNTFCHFKNQKIEILIRGSNKFTEPKEKGYGEYLFFRSLPSRQANLLSLNKSRGDTFRLFLGTSPFCSKSHGYLLDSKKLAVLLLKENRPFHDKLVIQFFDIPELRPADFLETNYPADKAIKTENGFAFRVLDEMDNPDIGSINIEGEKFIFQEKVFPLWINYSSNSFAVSPELTYSQFPWKKAFRDEKEFLEMTGWDAGSRTFKRKTIYIAASHKLGKECILLLEGRLKPTGTEAWRCQAR